MSLNYGIIDSIKLLSLAFRNDMFIAILLGTIILTIIFVLNKEQKFIKYLIIVLSLFQLVFILYYYLEDILTFKFSNPINNIYFYFFNSIIYLILITIMFIKTKYKRINYVFYSLSLINLSYSIFVTHYLKNNTLFVIGNIFPMIKFGNIIYFIYYLFLIYFIIVKVLSNRGIMLINNKSGK